MSDKSDDVKIAAYGSWSSPITSEMAVQGGGFTGLASSPLAEVHTCVNDNNEGIEFLETHKSGYCIRSFTRLFCPIKHSLSLV